MTQAMDEPALLSQLRAGHDSAFGELYELHSPAVRRLAMGIARDRSEAEDITAEAFFRVLRAVKRGNGPTDNVRGYLLTVARRVAWEWHGASHDVPVTDDELTSRAGASECNPSRTAEYTLITRAFTSLPERWRAVLWQTEVEGAKPAVVAPDLGLSPNATAALARRARQGLRAAYLQAHLATHQSDNGCRSVLEKLGGYTAGSVTGTEASRINTHLGGCSRCRATHDELRDVCFSLRADAGAIALVAGAGISGAGVSGAVKSVFAGAKLKLGAAVASTAAIGVIGLSIGPVLGDSPSEVLGLNGQQGVPQVLVERSSESDGESASRFRTGTAVSRDRAAAGETEKSSDADVDSSAADPPETRQQQTRRTSPSSSAAAVGNRAAGEQRRSTATASGDAASTASDESERAGSEPKSPPPASSAGEDPPEETPPADRPTSGDGSTERSPGEPPPDGGDGARDGGSGNYEPCVDDYEYSETYNEERKRREIYEYSYRDGVGYERLEYYYDNGRYERYEYRWWDSC
ncbi:MAG: sigma-70 family RNA polymerase sigma factor [Actinophytocola sp.]|nr:sigma-70 family RNA polymerase sigma factor [Actinophytocola sp.]